MEDWLLNWKNKIDVSGTSDEHMSSSFSHAELLEELSDKHPFG